MKKVLLRNLLDNALVAAIYVTLSAMLIPFSFNTPQIRLAEMLILLCFFRKDFIFGVTLGCLLTNTFSTLGPWDMLFGTLATMISCIIVAFCRHLLISSLIPVVINGFVVGAELYFILDLPFWINVGWVALGEFLAVVVIGYFLCLMMMKREDIQRILRITQNNNFKW